MPCQRAGTCRIIVSLQNLLNHADSQYNLSDAFKPQAGIADLED